MISLKRIELKTDPRGEVVAMIPVDPLEQLKKLAELRATGVISPAEFDAKKGQLLSLVGQPVAPAGDTGNADPSFSDCANASEVPDVQPIAHVQDLEQIEREMASNALPWESTVDELEPELRHADAILAMWLTESSRAQRYHLYYSQLVSLRSLLSGVWIVGCVLIGTCTTWGIGALIALAVGFRGLQILPVSLVGGTIGFVALLHALVLPSTNTLRQWARSWAEKLEVAKFECLRVAHARRYRLLTYNWRGLRGVPLEQFLARVFEELGYNVETTKVSGDQGVDLIVVKENVKTAIQVKGYEQSVGNNAVQEAYTGMSYYECHRCAVITNSSFTLAAIDLAQKVGCRLIDGTQIAALIEGNLVL